MPQLEVPGGDAGGETIHYQRAGSGAKVIVLVHGFGSDARSWTMNQPGLAASAKVMRSICRVMAPPPHVTSAASTVSPASWLKQSRR